MPSQITPGYPMISTSGQMLVFHFDDGAGNAVNVTACASAPSIAGASNSAAVNNLPTFGNVSNRGPLLCFPLTAVCLSTDSITWSASSGWVTTANGSPATLSGSVTNNTGQQLFTTPSGTQTMGVGFNIPSANYFSCANLWANLCKQASNWSGSSLVLDSNQYPVSWSGGSPSAVLCECPANPSGYRNVPPGNGPEGDIWTLMWDNPLHGTIEGNFTLSANAHCTVTEITGSYTLNGQNITLPFTGNATNNARVYHIDRTTGFYVGVQINCTVQGSGGNSAVANARVYRPGVATDGSQTFDPNVIGWLKNARAIRFMDALWTNNCSLVNYSDWLQGPEFTYGNGGGAVNSSSNSPGGIPKTRTILGLTSVTSYSNSDNYFPTSVGLCLFTTSANHGMVDGQIANIGFASSITFTDGVNTQAQHFSNPIQPVHVISANQFALQLTNAVYPTVQGTQALAGNTGTPSTSDYFGWWINPAMPVADIILLCNTVGADAWIALPNLITNAAATSLADALCNPSTGLHSGLKVHVELSNETWNGSFQQNIYFNRQGSFQGISGDAAYALRASQIHTIFVTEFTAQGRGSDVVRVFGSWYAQTSRTTNIVNKAVAAGFMVDRIAVAPYFDGITCNTWNLGSNGAGNANGDAYTPDMCHDVTAARVMANEHGLVLAGHNTILQAQFPAARMACYEGGPQSGITAGSTAAIASTTSMAWARHPRMWPLMMLYLQSLQSAGGCVLYMDYILWDTMQVFYLTGANPDANWGCHLHYDSVPGKGDGSDGLNNNTANYAAYDSLVSPIAYGIQQWLALAATPSPPPPSAGQAGVICALVTITEG